MKKLTITLILTIAIITSIGVSYAQTEDKVPVWIKSIAGWWSEDKLTDDEFIEALEFLIDSNIIVLDNTSTMSVKEVTFEKKYNELKIGFDSNTANSKKAYNELDIKFQKTMKEMKAEFHDDIKEVKQDYQNQLDKKEESIKKLKKINDDLYKQLFARK